MGGSFSAINHVLPIPGGVGHGGVIFSYEPRTPDSGDENRCPNRISLVGQVQMCVQIFPVSNLGGCAPLVVKQIRYELATIHVMLIPGPFWPADWYQKAHFGHMRER